MKLVDPVRARTVVELGMTMPAWTDIPRLDVTAVPAAQAARTIIDMLPAPHHP